MTLRALVTAGGTREPIDDVRVITNLSRGWFGAAIAKALAERGVATTLLGSKELLRAPERLDPRLTLVPFESYADLAWELERNTGEGRPDLLFMAAAVSDYTPVRADGKLPSSQDELTITLRRTPKLLAGLRARCGEAPFLVGFKLLSGVSRAELVATALRQSRENGLDLTVANDLQDLGPERHPVVLVTPEGATVPIDDAREVVAARIVDLALRRRAARRPGLVLSREPAPEGDPAARAADDLARVAADAHLGASLVAHRSRTGGLWVAAAGRLADGDVHVTLDDGDARLLVQGAEAAPRASAVGAWLLPRVPGVEALLRVGGGLALEDAEVSFPYPPGSLEEAAEVHQALARAARAGRWSGGSFAVRLAGPDVLLGLTRAGAEELAGDWAAATQEQARHLEAAGAGAAERARALELSPVLEETRIVGVLGRDDAAGWTTLFVRPRARGRGLGDRCADELDRRGDRVGVHEASGALAWWLGRGWRLVERVEGVALLDPPSSRADLDPAASACAVDALGGRVLLGRRRRDPWKGAWSFPGGRLERGEDHATCAARELREETGVSLPVTTPSAEHVVVVGAPDGGGRAYRIACQVFLLLDAPAPTPTDELEAEWVALDDALARSPMAPGTRRVLRALAGR